MPLAGAANGIGKAVAQRFAKSGATVVAVDINKRAVRDFVNSLECRDGSSNHLALHCDVSNPDFVNHLKEIVHDQYNKPVDCLVNNAGVTKDAQLHKMTIEQWEWVISVNLRAVWLLTKTFTEDMLPGGSVTNISSIVGKTGNFGQTNYAASKAGVIGMTKSAAIELGRRDIRVNSVLPGYIRTEMTQKLPDKVVHQILQNIPMRRMGTPEEIANVCHFLATKEASYINGAAIEVTGGYGA